MLFDAIEVLIKYGLSWGAVIVLLVRNRKLRRYMNSHLPKMLQDRTDSDITEIKHDVKSILKHLGVEGECATFSNHSTPSLALKSKESFISRWVGFITARSVKNNTNLNGGKQMKAYLQKLGSRKFQAFLVATATNVIMLTGYLLNVENIQEIANEWMPAVNVAAQTIATLVYIWAQGKVDGGKADEPDYSQADLTSE